MLLSQELKFNISGCWKSPLIYFLNARIGKLLLPSKKTYPKPQTMENWLHKMTCMISGRSFYILNTKIKYIHIDFILITKIKSNTKIKSWPHYFRAVIFKSFSFQGMDQVLISQTILKSLMLSAVPFCSSITLFCWRTNKHLLSLSVYQNNLGACL